MIFVVGLSHRTAPLEVRERFSTASDVLPAVLARLASRRELDEVLFLSTCNRVEVFAAGGEHATQALREVLAEQGGVERADIMEAYLYEHAGDDAVRHIFRVAASLDSMVLGEPQILGQVKDAYEAAVAAGTLGSFLGRCVHRAFAVAKRVRTETALGEGNVSISSVAVDLARRIFVDLSSTTVLLIGAGEMAEAAAKGLGRGARAVRVCNRSFDRGAALARTFGGVAAPWEALSSELVIADVVVASTASPTFIVTRDMMRKAMKARRGRPLFFIDIAVPRNVEPSVHGIDNVYVYNIDDLEQQVAEGLKSRQEEVGRAEAMVAAELRDFQSWARGLHVQPTLVALRSRTRAVLLGELERSLTGRLKHLGEGDRAALTQMMESAANKLLHMPTTRLKARAGDPEGLDLARALEHLFDLEDAKAQAQADDAGRVTH
jgi:glutamyl-tRNA reductase